MRDTIKSLRAQIAVLKAEIETLKAELAGRPNLHPLVADILTREIVGK